MDYRMSNDEFKKAVMKEAQRISGIVEQSEVEAPILAAAISVVVGCFICAAAIDKRSLQDMLRTMINSITLEAEIGYSDLQDRGTKP